VSSLAIAAGAVRWKNDSTKLASMMPSTTRRTRTKRASTFFLVPSLASGMPRF
jgi:hypothetical protein